MAREEKRHIECLECMQNACHNGVYKCLLKDCVGGGVFFHGKVLTSKSWKVVALHDLSETFQGLYVKTHVASLRHAFEFAGYQKEKEYEIGNSSKVSFRLP